MRRSLSGLWQFGSSLVLAVGLCLLLASLVDGGYWLLSASQKQSAAKSKKKGKKKGQPVEEAPSLAVVEESDDPKPPKDDFTVQVYQKMDEAKLEDGQLQGPV